MFSFWYELPVILRVVLSLVLIGISVLAFFLADRIWVSPAAVGLVLLFFCGSGGNTNGYNF
jgi:hypothetical protein